MARHETPVQVTCKGCLGTFVATVRGGNARCGRCGTLRWVPRHIEAEEWVQQPSGRHKAQPTEVEVTCPSCGQAWKTRAASGKPNATCPDCGKRTRVPHREPVPNPEDREAIERKRAGAPVPEDDADPPPTLPETAEPATENPPRVVYESGACPQGCGGDLYYVERDTVACLSCRLVVDTASVSAARRGRPPEDPYPRPQPRGRGRRGQTEPPRRPADHQDAYIIDAEVEPEDDDEAAPRPLETFGRTLEVLNAARAGRRAAAQRAQLGSAAAADYRLYCQRSGQVTPAHGVARQVNPWEQPNAEGPPCDWCESMLVEPSLKRPGVWLVTNDHFRAQGRISLLCEGHRRQAEGEPVAWPGSGFTATRHPHSARGALALPRGGSL